jgi:hypothetical protein
MQTILFALKIILLLGVMFVGGVAYVMSEDITVTSACVLVCCVIDAFVYRRVKAIIALQDTQDNVSTH